MQKVLTFFKAHWGKILLACLVFAIFIAAPLFKFAKEKKLPLAEKLPEVTPAK